VNGQAAGQKMRRKRGARTARAERPDPLEAAQERAAQESRKEFERAFARVFPRPSKRGGRSRRSASRQR
jgi:hypothetical protein